MHMRILCPSMHVANFSSISAVVFHSPSLIVLVPKLLNSIEEHDFYACVIDYIGSIPVSLFSQFSWACWSLIRTRMLSISLNHPNYEPTNKTSWPLNHQPRLACASRISKRSQLMQYVPTTLNHGKSWLIVPNADKGLLVAKHGWKWDIVFGNSQIVTPDRYCLLLNHGNSWLATVPRNTNTSSA